jgi:hypothetical protein
MTDLEQRVTDALVHGAEDAPSPVGLAVAARVRAARKRRTWIGGAVAAVALCLAVPTAVVAARGSDDAGPSPSHAASDGAPERAVPDGMRVESWHGVTALVPDSWGYGSLETWCADGGAMTPRVQRPGGVTLDIKCETSTYGLSFQELPPGQDRDQVFDWPVTLQTSEGWPPDAYVGAHGIGNVLVEVVMPTAEQAQEVLGTVHAIEGVDLNGCRVSGSAPEPPNDGMSVCRYDGSGQLEQSELLTGGDVGRAEEALAAAPDVEAPACLTYEAPPRRLFIRLSSRAVDAVIDLGCGWLTLDGVSRAIPSDVLYWALSPGWSGSVPEGVSLPSELRQR